MTEKGASRKLPREEAIMLLREAQADNNILRAENERLRQELVKANNLAADMVARRAERIEQLDAYAKSEKLLHEHIEKLRAELATCADAAKKGKVRK